MVLVYVHETGQLFTVRKKSKIRKQTNQVPHLTQDTILENDKNTLSRKRHTQDSLEASNFSAGDHNAARNRQNSVTKVNTRHK